MEKLPTEIFFSITQFLDRPSLIALRQSNRLLAGWALPNLVGVLRLEDNDDGFGRQWRDGNIRKIEYSSLPETLKKILALAPFIKKVFMAPMFYQSGIWKIYEREREKSFVNGYIDIHENEDLWSDCRIEIRGFDSDEEEYENNDGIDALGDRAETQHTDDDWESLTNEMYYEKMREARREDFTQEMIKVREMEVMWEQAVEMQNTDTSSTEAALCEFVEHMRLLQSLEIKTKDFIGYKGQGWECTPLIEVEPKFSTTTTSLHAFAKALKFANHHISELILREVYSSHLKTSDYILHAFRNIEKLEIHFLETDRLLETEPRTEDWAQAIAESRNTLKELTIKRRPEGYDRKMHCLQDLLGASPKDNLLPIVFPKLTRLVLSNLTTSTEFLGPFLAAQTELRFLSTESVAFENSYGKWNDVAQLVPSKVEEWHVESNYERRDVDFGDVVHYDRSWMWSQDIRRNPTEWHVPGWENELVFGMLGASMGRARFRRKGTGRTLR